MNGRIEELKPETDSLLRRHRLRGNWALLTMIATGFGGLYWTHVCDFSDAFMWAVITFCVVLAEMVLGCYHLSRSEIPVNNPNIILTALLAVGGAALGGLLLYWSWERYFTSRDEDAGLAVALIALYIFFKPLQYVFVFCNYKKGLYYRMLREE